MENIGKQFYRSISRKPQSLVTIIFNKRGHIFLYISSKNDNILKYEAQQFRLSD